MNDITFQNQMISSLEVAQVSDKNHKEVMRDIRVIIDKLNVRVGGSADSRFQINSSTYSVEGQTRTYPMYMLDHEMFLLVITGYRLDIRQKLIKRWMELEAKERQQQALELPTDVVGMFNLAAKAMTQLQEEQKRLAATQEHMKIKQEQMEARLQLNERQLQLLHASDEGDGYSTVMGFTRLFEVKLPKGAFQRVGIMAAKMCKEQGLEIEPVYDKRWGSVNAYPDRIIALAISLKYPNAMNSQKLLESTDSPQASLNLS